MNTKLCHKKLPGFSLTEVLFNIILLSLLSACGYLGYEYMFADAAGFTKANEAMSAYARFSDAFTIDAGRCARMERAGGALMFTGADSSLVQYEFSAERVLRRRAGVTDTFDLSLLSFSALYNEAERTDGLVEEVQLQLECGGKKFSTTFSRMYDAETLLKEQNFKENKWRSD